MPRIFRYEDQADRIIYDENQEVGEMYFLREGSYSIAINAYSRNSYKPFYKTLMVNQDENLIGDYYVIH